MINTAAILAGSTAGLALRGKLRVEVTERVMQAVALFVVVVGLQMALGQSRGVVVLLGLAFGAIAGEALRLEQRLESASQRAEERLACRSAVRGGESKATHEDGGRLSRGFVVATLLFCVGPMAIMGAFQDGVQHQFTVLLNKSLLDGVGSIALAASLGPGVALSAISVFLYQGLLTLAAASLRNLMSAATIADMSVTGGVLIVAIGLNMLKVTRIRVGNMLPALVFVVVLSAVADLLAR